jgi:hypothetical protein
MRAHTQTLLDTQHAWGNDELTSRALPASLARRFEQLLDDGRSVPGSLEVRRVPGLVLAAAQAVRGRTSAGSVAVVAADPALLRAVGQALEADGVAAVLLEDGAAAAPVALVPSSLVKGLEFDSVVLLEPASAVRRADASRPLPRRPAPRAAPRRAGPAGHMRPPTPGSGAGRRQRVSITR